MMTLRVFIMIVATSLSIQVAAQKNYSTRHLDSLYIGIANVEKSKKYISRQIRKQNGLRILTINIDQGKWVGHGYMNNQFLPAAHSMKPVALPEALGEQYNLERLYIADLNLKQLPSFITRLDRLTVLDISFNPADYEEEMGKLTTLRNLHVLKVYGATESEVAASRSRFRSDLVVLFTVSDYRKDMASSKFHILK